MTDESTGAPTVGGPSGDELTNAEKLTALQAYTKALKPIEDALRAAVVAELGARKVERVGAYLPGADGKPGEKMGAVAYSPGRKTAVVTDAAAALKWCLERHPEAVIRAITPGFLKGLTDYAARVGEVGESGVCPDTGEALDFITVRRGDPFVTVTPTKLGIARMTALASGFAGLLEAGEGDRGQHEV